MPGCEAMRVRVFSKSSTKASGALGLFAVHQAATSAIDLAALLTMRSGKGALMTGEFAGEVPTRLKARPAQLLRWPPTTQTLAQR